MASYSYDNFQENALRDTLYNHILAATIELGKGANLTTSDIKVRMVKSALFEMLRSSQLENGNVASINGAVSVEKACSQANGDLLAPFHALRMRLLELKSIDHSLLHHYLVENPQPSYHPHVEEWEPLSIAQAHLDKFARAIIQKPRFQEEWENIEIFCREVHGETVDPYSAKDPRIEGVTALHVRTTFYNVMAEQAFKPELFPQADLQDNESYIYIGLPAVALLEVMLRSDKLNEAVWLCENKFLTKENCPEEFRRFAEVLMPLKIAILKQSKENQQLLRYACTCDDNRPIALSMELNSLKAKICSVATEVSQTPSFRVMVPEILKLFEG